MGLIISALAWRGAARVIRAQVLSMRERPYVMMARLNGMSGSIYTWALVVGCSSDWRYCVDLCDALLDFHWVG